MATDLERLVVRLEAQIKSYENEMKRARSVSDRAMRDVESSVKSGESRIGSSMQALGAKASDALASGLKGGLVGVAAGLAASLSIDTIKSAADEWTSLGNKLRASGLDATQAAIAQERIVAIAGRSRSDIGAVGDLYQRLSLASKDLGSTQQDVAVATETVTKALKMGGISAQDQAAAVLQLGQALASGTLQGDELRSIMENAPQLAQIIAREFGISIGELKQWGSEGKLAAGQVMQALVKAAPEIDKAFAQSNRSFADSAIALKNAILEFVGSIVDAIRESAAHKLAVEQETVALDELRRSYGLLRQEQQAAATTKTEQRLSAEIKNTQQDIENVRTSLRAAIADLQQFGAIGIKADEKARLIEMLNQALDGDAAAADKAVVELERMAQVNPVSQSALSSLRDLAQQLGLVQRQAVNAKKALEEVNAVKTPGYKPPAFFSGESKAGDAQIQADSVAIANRMLDAERIKSQLDKNALQVLTKREELAKKFTDKGLPIPANLDQVAKEIVANENARSGGGGGGGGKSDEELFADVVRRSEKRIAQMRLEQEAVGRSTYENARAQEALRLMEDAKQRDVELTDVQKQRIEQLADAYAKQKVATEEAAQAQQASNELARFAGQSLSSFFSDVVSGGKNAEQALMNLTKRLADAALQAILLGDGPLGKVFGLAGTSGKAGGLIGSLFSGFNIPAHAAGTNASAGGLSLVGEKGPELLRLPIGSQVVPNSGLRGMSGGGVTVMMQNDFRGTDPTQQAWLEQRLRIVERNAVNAAIAAVPAARRNDPGYL